jgi:signal transduction histidine kinase
VWLLHHMLTRPVNRVLSDVTSVADGDYDRAIRSAGLREVSVLAAAAETMRDNLRASTTRLLDAERRDEQARMAADLNDRTIQRVFALGLGLTSAAQRRSPDLKPFVDETDRIIADLRHVVFNLDPAAAGADGERTSFHGEVIDVVEGSASAFGFAPDLEFDGPIDARTTPSAVRTAIVDVLRDLLDTLARQGGASAVAVRFAAADGQLALTVRDNGIADAAGPDGDVLGRIRRRAEEFGGHATRRHDGDGGGTVVEWVIPLTDVS